jgi:hypothetical protein
MNRWDILRHKCPRLYKDGIVFECPHGWYEIVHDLSLKIEAILEESAENFKLIEYEQNEIFAIQVKAEYGTLRFYMSYPNAKIDALISEAEALCGKAGKMRGKTWFEVKCDKCYGGI